MPQSENKTTANDAPSIEVHLDVQNIDDTCAFWCGKLGFEPVGEKRLTGTFLEVQSIARPDMPGYWLTFHCCAPSPAAGSWKGSIKRVCVRVADIEQTVRLIGDDAPWLANPLESLEGGAPLRLLDPNGYQIELLGGPPAAP